MNSLNEPAGSQVYYRLIALWVLCEAMLGGVIHAFRIPVSGLMVGSGAVVCICLIGYYKPAKGAIIKATIIVAIFKMLLSPQAPPLAYFAVFFQGLTGEIFLVNKKFYKTACVIIGLISLLESALQRILVLTIVYGNSFWKAINEFINQLTGQNNFTNYSLYIGIVYVLIHLVVGVSIGIFAANLPEKILLWKQRYPAIEPAKAFEPFSVPVDQKRKKKIKKGLIIIWIVLVLVYLQSYLDIGTSLLPPNLAIQILVRSVLIVLGWYLIVGPVLSLILKKWLEKKKIESAKDIGQVLQLLPQMRQIVSKSWIIAGEKKGLKKVMVFMKVVLVNALNA